MSVSYYDLDTRVVQSYAHLCNVYIIIWVAVSNTFIFTPIGEDFFQFDKYFSDGLKPPTRYLKMSIHLIYIHKCIYTSTSTPWGALTSSWRNNMSILLILVSPILFIAWNLGLVAICIEAEFSTCALNGWSRER